MADTPNPDQLNLAWLKTSEWKLYIRDCIEDTVATLTLSSTLRGISRNRIVPEILKTAKIYLTTEELEKIVKRLGYNQIFTEAYISSALEDGFIRQVDDFGNNSLWSLTSKYSTEQ